MPVRNGLPRRTFLTMSSLGAAYALLAPVGNRETAGENGGASLGVGTTK
jgi:hypothetical protein